MADTRRTAVATHGLLLLLALAAMFSAAAATRRTRIDSHDNPSLSPEGVALASATVSDEVDDSTVQAAERHEEDERAAAAAHEAARYGDPGRISSLERRLHKLEEQKHRLEAQEREAAQAEDWEGDPQFAPEGPEFGHVLALKARHGHRFQTGKQPAVPHPVNRCANVTCPQGQFCYPATGKCRCPDWAEVCGKVCCDNRFVCNTEIIAKSLQGQFPPECFARPKSDPCFNHSTCTESQICWRGKCYCPLNAPTECAGGLCCKSTEACYSDKPGGPMRCVVNKCHGKRWRNTQQPCPPGATCRSLDGECVCDKTQHPPCGDSCCPATQQCLAGKCACKDKDIMCGSHCCRAGKQECDEHKKKCVVYISPKEQAFQGWDAVFFPKDEEDDMRRQDNDPFQI